MHPLPSRLMQPNSCRHQHCREQQYEHHSHKDTSEHNLNPNTTALRDMSNTITYSQAVSKHMYNDTNNYTQTP